MGAACVARCVFRACNGFKPFLGCLEGSLTSALSYVWLGMRVCHMMALHGGLNPKPQSDTTVTHGLLTPNHAKCIRRVLPVCSHVYDTYITD